ncbi:hypothetical protein DUNSADRAFT_17460 [Dunaliella salina]|uniref:Farnesoic acid O-methyl transferase domain-containing protein n=1 Tax=Dunaliella salina TaxID=3046 RepID=A0ABQ7G1R8_DUNSA|nr:hypothetical protein DUNSADRAFT_17460 [Dunaliella salina]|eukprot:KAF5828541.1 hypothetical protein DUNSADRAFT_17460 [Dunaliella salina]
MHAIPHLNFDGTLVVPPFECAWLGTGSNGHAFKKHSGCVCFEAKADNDVTIILKPLPGTKRVQPLQHVPSTGNPGHPPNGSAHGSAPGTATSTPRGSFEQHAQPNSSACAMSAAVEPNYTIILGSHRNSCLKVEKNGVTRAMVQGPGSRISSRTFSRFWVNYSAAGVITVGSGEPSPSSPFYQWTDPEGPIPGIQHVGLSSWDSYVSYRCIQVLPPCRFAALPSQHSTLHGNWDADEAEDVGYGMGGWQKRNVVPTLVDLCSQRLIDLLSQPAGQGCGRSKNEGIRDATCHAADGGACANGTNVDDCSRSWGSDQGRQGGGSESAWGLDMPPACHVAQVAELLLPTTRSLYSASLAHLAANFEHISRAPHAAAVHRPPPCPVSAAPLAPPTSTAHQVPRESSHMQPGQPSCATAAAEGMAESAFNKDAPYATPPVHQILYPPASPSHSLPHQQQQQQQHSNVVHQGHCVHAGDTSACCRVCQDAPPPACLTPFEQLPASVLCDLLALNSVAASEAAIFEAVARWAAAGGFGGDEEGREQGHVLDPHRHVGGGGHTCGTGDGLQINDNCHTCDPPMSCPLSNGGYHGGSLGERTSPGTAHEQHQVRCGGALSSNGGPDEVQPQTQYPSSSSTCSSSSSTVYLAFEGHSASLPAQAQVSCCHPYPPQEAHRQSQSSLPTPPLPAAAPDAADPSAPTPAPPAAAPTAPSLLPSIRHEPSDVLRVLSLVRFPLMKPQELEAVARHPLLAHHFPSLLPLVAEAAQPYSEQGLCGHTSSASALAVDNRQLLLLPKGGMGELEARPGGPQPLLGNVSRFTRRALPCCHECAYVCDGDANGVLHYIGTAQGTQAWVNPVLAKRVTVRASSPASRHTDPKTLCGEKFQATHFAGPRYINGVPDTWWLVDLGAAHTLSPTHYTIRHDASEDFVRSWVLQGSMDGVLWTDLRKHINDRSIKKPAQYASWPVIGSAAQAAYRMFRLLLLGPTTSRERPYNFPLTYIELYGYLN